MSVMVMLRAKGDPAALESWAASHKKTLMDIAAEGKAAGAIHHTFAAGNGEVCVIDEWPDAESFQKFFAGQADIPKVMAAGGIQGQPEITVMRKMDMPDEF
jgi:hypothetical protein